MRRGISLIEFLVIVAIIGTLIGLSIPAVRKARESSVNAQCQHNLRDLGLACRAYVQKNGYYPRNTVRPRGSTAIDAQPAGNEDRWQSGTFESWIRQLTPHIKQKDAKAQDAIAVLACPTDPRGRDYKIPTHGFTWYVGIYANPAHPNNGIIVDDSRLRTKLALKDSDITDGTSNTIMIGERPPSGDGQWGWWDSPCCTQDTLSPARGGAVPYDSGTSLQTGASRQCPPSATYGAGSHLDSCAFNALWSYHARGGNFCMGDGSVRTIAYDTGNRTEGPLTLLEALASRAGNETISSDY